MKEREEQSCVDGVWRLMVAGDVVSQMAGRETGWIVYSTGRAWVFLCKVGLKFYLAAHRALKTLYSLLYLCARLAVVAASTLTSNQQSSNNLESFGLQQRHRIIDQATLRSQASNPGLPVRETSHHEYPPSPLQAQRFPAGVQPLKQQVDPFLQYQSKGQP